MMLITRSTFSSSVQMRKVVLPAIRKPPVEASLVAKKPFWVKAPETEELSSLLTIA